MKNAICVKCGSSNLVAMNSVLKEFLCHSCSHLYNKYGEVDLSKKRLLNRTDHKSDLNKNECCICRSEKYVQYCGKYGNYLCGSHLAQFRKHGEIVNKKIKNINKGFNEIEFVKDYVELILTDINGIEKCRTKIDIEELDKIKDIRWSVSKGGHSGIYVNSKKGRLHRFIMNCPKDLMVDHINHDHLDNRKLNLRICTNQQNCMNSSLHSINTSGCSGIHFDLQQNKWVARIGLNGDRLYLGGFTDKQDAINARKNAEEKYYGEFRNIAN